MVIGTECIGRCKSNYHILRVTKWYTISSFISLNWYKEKKCINLYQDWTIRSIRLAKLIWWNVMQGKTSCPTYYCQFSLLINFTKFFCKSNMNKSRKGNTLDLIFLNLILVFNATFSYIMATSFSGGRSRSIRREPPAYTAMGDQLINFITCESSAPGREPTPYWW